MVGAGEAYGPQALEIATLIKLTRALWIIPLAFVTMLIFRDKTAKISIPWFIFLFVIAMVINTYCGLPEWLTGGLVYWAKKGMDAHFVPDRCQSVAGHYPLRGREAIAACDHAVDRDRFEQFLRGDGDCTVISVY